MYTLHEHTIHGPTDSYVITRTPLSNTNCIQLCLSEVANTVHSLLLDKISYKVEEKHRSAIFRVHLSRMCAKAI
jgi:hypothetical protein